MFEALGAFVFRFRWAVLAGSATFVCLAMALLIRGGSMTSGVIHGLEAEKAQQIIDAATGHPADTTVVVVFHADGLDARDPAFADAVRTALAPLRGDPHIAQVVWPEVLPAPLAASMIDGPGGAELAFVSLRGDFREALAAYPAVRARLRSERLTVDCTGRVQFMHDLDSALEHDLLKAEMFSLPLALLVLLLQRSGRSPPRRSPSALARSPWSAGSRWSRRSRTSPTSLSSPSTSARSSARAWPSTIRSSS